MTHQDQKQQEEHATVGIMLRVPPAVRHQLEQIATAERRSLSNAARCIIEAALAERSARQQAAA